MLSPFACRLWPAERLKLRKYFINDKNYSQNVVNHDLQAILTGKVFLYNDTDG